MKSELSFKTVACSTDSRCCKDAWRRFEVWASRRQEICEARSCDEESGAELLRLQADYAKSYNDPPATGPARVTHRAPKTPDRKLTILPFSSLAWVLTSSCRSRKRDDGVAGSRSKVHSYLSWRAWRSSNEVSLRASATVWQNTARMFRS